MLLAVAGAIVFCCARLAADPASGTRAAVVLFARFANEGSATVPSWAARILAPDVPGSFSHYWETMSFGQLQVRGAVAPRVYLSAHDVTTYLADDSTQVGQFGRFSLEVLMQADRDVDFAAFDNDGPDGVPNSGDDDGIVDALFIVIATAPTNFLLGGATGVAGLGLQPEVGAPVFPDPVLQGTFYYVTGDTGASGQPIRISSRQGTIQQGRSLAVVVGSMCHEFGHLLGLPDLYNVGFVRTPGALPAEDSAGVGRWCLMGWGAYGWQEQDGPTSLCAWSRMRLGWAEVTEPHIAESEFELEDVGVRGHLHKVPLASNEYYLLEFRTRRSSYYDRGLPGEGLLIWHVLRTLPESEAGSGWIVDLECADGEWADAGYPLGREPLVGGGDNLDFWSHDPAYSQAHGGNLGDATDPFGVPPFTAFSASTNPAAVGADGVTHVAVTQITVDGQHARAQVRVSPSDVEMVTAAMRHEYVAAGTPVDLVLSLRNSGGLTATGLRAVLGTDSRDLELLDREIALRDLGAGSTWFGAALGPEGYPQVRFRQDLDGESEAQVTVQVYVGDTLQDQAMVALRGTPAHLVRATVLAPDETPLQDASVAVAPSSTGTQGAYFTGAVKTDLGGRADLLLPTGTYTFTVSPPGGADLVTVTRAAVDVAGDMELEFAVPGVLALTLEAVDALGRGIAGVSFSASPTVPGLDEISATTDLDGRAVVRVLRGTCLLQFRGVPDPFVVPEEASYQLLSDTTLTITLSSGHALGVQLLGPDGGLYRTGKGIGVRLLGVDLPLEHSEYLPEGTASAQRAELVSWRVPDGRYVLRILESSGTMAPQVSDTFAVARDTTVLHVVEPGISVSGAATNTMGALPASASIRFENTSMGAQWVQVETGLGDGHYRVALIEGDYRVSLGSFDGSVARQEVGLVAITGDTLIDWVVDIGQLVVGRVSGMEEWEGWAFTVIAQDLEHGTRSTTEPSSDGRFALLLPIGMYRLSVKLWASYGAAWWNLGAVRVPSSQDTVHLAAPLGARLELHIDDRSSDAPATIIKLHRSPLDLAAEASDDYVAQVNTRSPSIQLQVPQGRYTVLAWPYSPPKRPPATVIGQVDVLGHHTVHIATDSAPLLHDISGAVEVASEPTAAAAPTASTGLFLSDLGRGLLQRTTVQDGEYRTQLPTGTYDVSWYKTVPGQPVVVRTAGQLSVTRDQIHDLRIETATSIAEPYGSQPTQLHLHPVFPNPFNASATLAYELPQDGVTELAIYTVLGQRVRRLVATRQAAGRHLAVWDGRDDRGRAMGSGVYLVRLSAQGTTRVGRMALIK